MYRDSEIYKAQFFNLSILQSLFYLIKRKLLLKCNALFILEALDVSM